MQMPFGKHKGDEIDDIPRDYLRWVFQNLELRQPLYDEIKRVLEENERQEKQRAHARSDYQRQQQQQRDRGGSGGGAAWPRQTLSGVVVSVPHGRLPLFRDLVEQGFRQLCRKHHPDAGGSNEAMAALNELRETLKEQLG